MIAQKRKDSIVCNFASGTTFNTIVFAEIDCYYKSLSKNLRYSSISQNYQGDFACGYNLVYNIKYTKFIISVLYFLPVMT